MFIKTVANPTHFGLRDRDFLTDNEIKNLKKQYSNYLVLDYYCFENYLYHPDNISELQIKDFNRNWYVEELIKQKNSKYDSILLKLTNARNSYLVIPAMLTPRSGDADPPCEEFSLLKNIEIVQYYFFFLNDSPFRSILTA